MKGYLKSIRVNVVSSIMVLLLLAMSTNLSAQNFEAAILQPFDSYRKNTLQEKMFVHTDKDFFVAGEICWFKIYNVDAFFHKPLDISKVAYVEVLDTAGKAVIQAKIALEQGSGNGSFYVPVTTRSGNYRLRAYSNWMKNFSADYFFQKTITIINTQQPGELPVGKKKAAYHIDFFPEGGNLVTGLESRVAFKAVDENGLGIDCKAVVINDRQAEVATFQTLKFGMGSFKFTPLAGRRYSAVVTMPDGTKINQLLPSAFNSGYVMGVADDHQGSVQVTVRVAAGDQVNDHSELYLFAHTRGSVKAAVTGGIKNGNATFTIGRDQLGDGISHFTVFNSERQPVCERLYFKYPAQPVMLRILTDRQDYGLRQKVDLNIAAVDQYANPLKADMSMAVYRVDSLQTPAESGISEYLWLSSDLRGNIESPGYYFDARGATADEAMDNLMLINGWRKFRWADILQGKKPGFKFTPEHNGHIITGKIVSSASGAATGNITAFFSVPGSTRFRTSKSDEHGNVRFEIKDFYGTPGVIVQTNPQTDSIYHVELDNPFSDQRAAGGIPPFAMPADKAITLLRHSIGMQVENIYTGDTMTKVRPGMIDTASFYGAPSYYYLLDNYTRFITMEEVLREYVFPVNVRRRSNKFHLPVMNDADKYNALFEADPLVLLDGVPVFDMDKLVAYDPLKIRKLEAVTRRYYYGQSAFDGVVNLVTYTGDLPGYELDPHATVIDYEAFQLEREFYSPVYETGQQVNSHVPDFRNVLSWQPTLSTGMDGKCQGNFYTSDIPGKYVVVLQALTPGGKTGSNSIYFEVKGR